MGYVVSITGDDYLIKTIVLLGCTGSGKSSTGNSILGENKFPAMKFSLGRVTTKCETGAVKIPNPKNLDPEIKIAGTLLNVIDTPGLFDASSKGEEVLKEIAVCINIARASGLEAVLMVVSLRDRFTEEQAAVVETLKYLFGERIVDYMIVAFTGGDHLEKSGKTLDHQLSSCQPLKELLRQCGDRKIVFNNKTKDEKKIAEKREELVGLIEQTVEKNGGKPYTYELFSQVEKERKESKNDGDPNAQKMTDEEIEKLIDAEVKKRLKKRDDDNMGKLKEDLERVTAQAAAKGLENKTLNEQIRELQRRVAKAEKEAAERWSCAVL